jgi:hypothetical protein
MGLFVDKPTLYGFDPGQGCDILVVWMKAFTLFPFWKANQESFDGLP